MGGGAHGLHGLVGQSLRLVRREARPLSSRTGLDKESATGPPPLVGLSSLLHGMRVLSVGWAIITDYARGCHPGGSALLRLQSTVPGWSV